MKPEPTDKERGIRADTHRTAEWARISAEGIARRKPESEAHDSRTPHHDRTPAAERQRWELHRDA